MNKIKEFRKTKKISQVDIANIMKVKQTKRVGGKHGDKMHTTRIKRAYRK